MCNHAFNGNMCILCGEIPLPVGFVPYKLLSEEHIYMGEKYQEKRRGSHRGTCSNCKRPNLFMMAHELCGYCVSYVNGKRGVKFTYGSASYKQALKDCVEKLKAKSPEKFKETT
jgi:hypothetical protein